MKHTVQFILVLSLIGAVSIGVIAMILIALYTSAQPDRDSCVLIDAHNSISDVS